MKIYFFKNEYDFCSRESVIVDNAELKNYRRRPKKLYYSVLFFTCFTMITALLLLNIDHHGSLLPVIISAFTVLLLHELCHALHCFVTGRGVERICFFPSGSFLTATKPTAYVKPAFNVWSKNSRIMFALFPLLLLTVIPATIVVFFPSTKHILTPFAAFNFVTSVFDICDAIILLSCPKDALYFNSFYLKLTEDSPATVHRVWISKDKKTVFHKHYEASRYKLKEISPPSETENVKHLIQEFKAQFKI